MHAKPLQEVNHYKQATNQSQSSVDRVSLVYNVYEVALFHYDLHNALLRSVDSLLGEIHRVSVDGLLCTPLWQKNVTVKCGDLLLHLKAILIGCVDGKLAQTPEHCIC